MSSIVASRRPVGQVLFDMFEILAEKASYAAVHGSFLMKCIPLYKVKSFRLSDGSPYIAT
jgi:hypothetical protein